MDSQRIISERLVSGTDSVDSLFLGGSIGKRFLNCRGPSDPAGGRYYLKNTWMGELTMRLDYS